MRGSEWADDKHSWELVETPGHCAARPRVLGNLTRCYRLCRLKVDLRMSDSICA